MIKGIIFDLDGTLTDSMPVWRNIGLDFLKSKGVCPPENLEERIRSMNYEQSVRLFHEECGVEATPEELLCFCRDTVAYQYHHHIQEKPGVMKMIKDFHSRGLALCVATATDSSLARAALKRLGMLDYFSFVSSCDDIGIGKDRPDIYLRAAGNLGLHRDEVIVFEDALHCVETAKQAGFFVVGVHDESAGEENFRIRELCDYYMGNYNDLEGFYTHFGIKG